MFDINVTSAPLTATFKVSPFLFYGNSAQKSHTFAFLPSVRAVFKSENNILDN